MSAIIDSNVTTVLTAAVLYQYGTGPVKGFAVTLIAGILGFHGHVDLRRAHVLHDLAHARAVSANHQHLTSAPACFRRRAPAVAPACRPRPR